MKEILNAEGKLGFHKVLRLRAVQNQEEQL